MAGQRHLPRVENARPDAGVKAIALRAQKLKTDDIDTCLAAGFVYGNLN
jgi:hypothetical protein